MKFSHFLIVAGLTLWIAETAYFGFNLYAISDVEKFWDRFAFILIIIGLLLDIIRINININKNGE
jgi:hypothetical protein